MASLRCRFVTLPVDQVLAQDEVVICMVTTRPPKTIVKPTALGPVANTDTKLLIYGLFQKGRVLAQDALGIRAESRVFRAAGLASDPWAAGGGRQAHRGCARLAQIGCRGELQATNCAPGRNTYPTAMPDSSSPRKGANC